MDEHASHTPEGHSLISPTNVTAILMRIAGSALQSSGHEKASELLKNWPEIVGVKIGKPFNKIQEKRLKGQEITQEDKKALEKALNENPKEAATLLGLLIAEATQGTLDADAELKLILESYALVLNTICALMGKAKTSLALKGFVHDTGCVSYWNFTKGSNPSFYASTDSLAPSGLEVYLFSEEPAADTLRKYNQEIRRAPSRQLERDKFNHRKHDTVALVKKVSELDVVIEKLDPDREEKMKLPDPLHLNAKYEWPAEFKYEIPFGAPALVELFESLFEARRSQGAPLQELDATREIIAGTLKKAS